jgi:hypothetical protein
MSIDPVAEEKSRKSKEDARGCLVGCVIIAVLGIIAIFPWARNLPPHVIEIENHYILEIPTFITDYFPPGYPTGIAFTPPAYVEIPPNLQGIIISLVITALACVFFMILYALRKTVPLFVQLAILLIEILLLVWVSAALIRWLLAPSGVSPVSP